MKYNYITVIVLFMLSCKEVNNCESRILSNEEIYSRAEAAIFIPQDAPLYLETGKSVPRDSLINFDYSQYAYSQYADCRDSIVKLIIRQVTDDDIKLRKKIDSLYSSNLELMIERIIWVEQDTSIQRKMIEMAIFNSPPELHDVNCDNISILIQDAFREDQNNRHNIDLTIDKANLEIIESIVEKCGFESIVRHGKKAVYGSFIIVQHAPARYRKKYIPFFEKAAEDGLLDKSTLALMIDRMLVESQEKQIYGTQYRYDKHTGLKELYPIQNKEQIDSIRSTVGLSPLSEYLERIKDIK